LEIAQKVPSNGLRVLQNPSKTPLSYLILIAGEPHLIAACLPCTPFPGLVLVTKTAGKRHFEGTSGPKKGYFQLPISGPLGT
jgi:hypothetical protein